MKKAISVMLVLSLLSIAGCSKTEGTFEIVSNQPVSIKVAEHTPSAASSALPVSSSDSAKSVSAPFQANLDMKSIQGKVKNIYYATDNKVIISADKLYLYDLAKGTAIGQTPLPFTDIAFVQPTKSGYVAVGENFDTPGGGGLTETTAPPSGTQCIYYDSDMKKISEISLGSIHPSGHSLMFANSIAISKDGNKLAFAVRDGLFLYDVSKSKKSTLLNFTSNPTTTFGIIGVKNLAFTNNDQRIAFEADNFNLPIVEGSRSFPTCGVINLDGTGLINNKTGDFSIYEMTNAYDSFAFFSEDFRKPSGRFLKMDTKSGKTEFLNSIEKEETAYSIGSDKGAYYATAMLKENNWIIRIYETQTGKLIAEQKAVCSEELYTYRVPAVKLFDASKTCIILLGNTQEKEYATKVFINQF